MGFCLIMLKLYGFDMIKVVEFYVCMGVNIFNRILVIEYNIILFEINKWMLGFKEIFEVMKFCFLFIMVILCRFFRDGYVLREF